MKWKVIEIVKEEEGKKWKWRDGCSLRKKKKKKKKM